MTLSFVSLVSVPACTCVVCRVAAAPSACTPASAAHVPTPASKSRLAPVARSYEVFAFSSLTGKVAA